MVSKQNMEWQRDKQGMRSEISRNN